MALPCRENSVTGPGPSGDHDIPPNLFARLAAGVVVGSRVGVSFNYQMEDSTSGLEIGGPGFSPMVFPELQEDFHIVGPSVSIAVSDRANIGASYGRVIAGRNTAVSNVIGVSLNYRVLRGLRRFPSRRGAATVADQGVRGAIVPLYTFRPADL